jgi:tetratricopeptide (TPR) repeat protein
LRAQHKLKEAMSSFKRALDIMEKTMGPNHPYLADALVGIGQVHLDAGEVAAARAPLERAVALLATASVRATDRADAQFTLAKALAAGQVDPARARSLAEAALSAYAGSRAFTEQRAEVAKWLAQSAVASARVR